MKVKLFTKAIAMILSVIIVISLLPLSVFAYESNSNIEYVVGGYEQLGYGFNALSDTVIKDTTLKNGSGMVFNYDSVTASLLSTSHSEADVKYAKTAQDLMLSFGINYTDQGSVGIPIKNAKFGLASKFGFSADIKNKTITESLYYYYREETLTGKYTLILPEGLLDDPSQIISDEFKEALAKLNSDYSDERCADFFDKWGTHILTSYNKGAALEYVAVGHSTGEEFSANSEITNKMSASVGIGGLTAESTQELATELGIAYNSSDYNFAHKWFVMGGDSNLIDANTISGTSIVNWKESVSQENSVLIPQSTEWISIWELIPNTYAGAKKALQEYYETQATGINETFFSQFTKYSEVKDTTDIYYTSPTGYISKITYHEDGTTKVAPGSKFNVVNLNTDLSKVVFGESSQYTVDEYGIVTIPVDTSSGVITVQVSDLEGNIITKKTFTVENEGAGLFEGGYGDKERPYLISSSEHFIRLNANIDYLSSYFQLIDDINMSGISFAGLTSFSGELDGNGHRIYNWSYSGSATNVSQMNMGFILENGGTIKNIRFQDCSVSYTLSNSNFGKVLNIGLVCGVNNGTIENVVVSGCTIKGQSGSKSDTNENTYRCRVGGIAGVSTKSVIKCGVIGCNISSVAEIGDACKGHGWPWTSDSSVGTADSYAGGLIGIADSSSDTSNCYSYINIITASSEGPDTPSSNCEFPGCDGLFSYCGGLLGRAIGGDSTVKVCVSAGNDISAQGDPDEVENSKIAEDASGSNCYSTSYGISDLNALQLNSEWTYNDEIYRRIGQYTSLSIDTQNAKTEYFVGEPFNLNGLIIRAIKDNASSTAESIDRGYTVSGYDPNTLGVQTITISYGADVNGKSITGTYEVTVVKPELCGIFISGTPYKTTYFKPFAKANFEGEVLDFTGLSVVAQYTDGTTAEIPLEELTLPDATIVTESKNIEITYNGFTANYKIEACDVRPLKIEVIENSYKKNYALGDAFDPTGLKVKVTYCIGDPEILGLDALTIDSPCFDMNTADTYSVTVKYEGLETSFDVVVGSVKEINIATMPDKLSYYSSEKKLVTDGLSLNVIYDNGATKVVSAGFSVGGYDNTNIGEQDIIVTYGGKTASFQITVIAVEMTSVEISESPKTKYVVGDVFTSSGLTLKVNYNDSSVKEISSGFTVKLDGYDVDTSPTLNDIGRKNVLVAYTENGVRKTVTYEIEIVKESITKLQVVKDSNKITYNLWDDFSYSGMMVYAVYASGKTEAIQLDKSMFSVQTFTSTGYQSVKLNYEGRSVEIVCTVNAPTSISVTKLPTKTEYEIGETVIPDGIEVTAHFDDYSSKLIDTTLLSFIYPSTETTGNKWVKINYGTLETEFGVTVKEKAVNEYAPQIIVSNAICSAGNTVTVTVDLLNNPGFSGLNIYLTFSDGLTLLEISNSIDLTFTNDVTMVWDGVSDYSEDGELLKLVFRVSDSAELGEHFVRANFVEAYTAELDDVTFATIDGYVNVIDFVYGDANGDGVVNTKDIILIRRHVAAKDPLTGISSVEVFEGADANGDSAINTKDIILVRRHVAAKDPLTGESSVLLGPNT